LNPYNSRTVSIFPEFSLGLSQKYIPAAGTLRNVHYPIFTTDFSEPFRKMVTPFSVCVNASKPSKRGGQVSWPSIAPEDHHFVDYYSRDVERNENESGDGMRMKMKVERK
jgi:hypothetical protein